MNWIAIVIPSLIAIVFLLLWWRESQRRSLSETVLQVERAQFQGERLNLQSALANAQVVLESKVQENVRRSLEFDQRVQEQKELLAHADKNFKESFQSVASQVLQQNTQSFLNLATERLDRKTMEARGTLDEKVQQFHQLIEPLKQTILKVETSLNESEKSRAAQFGAISNQLLAVAQSSENLRKEAGNLTSALRRPEVRGSWGEIQLRRVVELAGMSAYCDFEEQVATRTKEDRLLKPDLIVHLPNKRKIVVDSKAVLDAFLTAVECENPEEKSRALIQHAKNLRVRVADLSKKAYWEQFEHSPDFAVLFIPNDALLSAAVDVDRNLIEDALEDRIVIATPSTLVALLKAVAYGWQQEQVSQNATRVIQAAKEVYDRMAVWLKHFQSVGRDLERAGKGYNDASKSIEARLMPSLRRLQEMGVGNGSDELEPPAAVTDSLRIPALPTDPGATGPGTVSSSVPSTGPASASGSAKPSIER